MGLNLTQCLIVADMHLLYSNEANGVLTYIPTPLLE